MVAGLVSLRLKCAWGHRRSKRRLVSGRIVVSWIMIVARNAESSREFAVAGCDLRVGVNLPEREFACQLSDFSKVSRNFTYGAGAYGQFVSDLVTKTGTDSLTWKYYSSGLAGRRMEPVRWRLRV